MSLKKLLGRKRHRFIRAIRTAGSAVVERTPFLVRESFTVPAARKFGKKKVKALFIIPGTGAGSSMIFARRLTSTLADRGIETVTFHLKTRISQYWGELPKLRSLIDSFNPDVVVAHFGSLTGFTAALLARRRALVIFRGSDLNPWNGPWLHVWVSHVLSHLAALTAHRIVCVSEELRNRLWWRRDSVDVLPSGVDDELFLPMDFTSARTELGWNPEDKVILFNASTRGKRLDRALAATSLAEGLLRRTVRLETLTGATEPNKIPLLMNAANCLLLVSDYEGSPTVVQEAMACQLPVVSVEVGDVREMLTGVNPSWIVPPDIEEIGRALAACLCSGQTVRSDGRKAMPRCSLLSIAKKLEDVFDDIQQRNGPTHSEDDGIESSAGSNYTVFALKGERSELLPHPSPEFEIEWWRPRALHWFPPTLPWLFGFWSLLHHLHLFPCRDFCIAYVRAGGVIVHRTCFAPRYFRWPFSAADDLMVTSTWTHRTMQRRGLASWALSWACQQLQKPDRTFWYLTRENNLASIGVCRKIGFLPVGTAQRGAWLKVRILGQFRLD